MVTVFIILIQTGIHLSHERVPVHTIAVKDGLIDFFLDIPRLCDLDAIGISLGILATF
jgi:hypothetical protein